MSSNMSSPVSEVFMQESLCTDLLKTISESIETSSEVNIEDSYSDDVVGHLLERMIQILPPEERNIFGCTEEKNIEEIIQEANELIRTTTPLFSSSDSSKKTTRDLTDKSSASESAVNKDYSKEIATNPKKSSKSDSICSSLESILGNESFNNKSLEQQDGRFHVDKSENLDKSKTDKENHENITELIEGKCIETFQSNFDEEISVYNMEQLGSTSVAMEEHSNNINEHAVSEKQDFNGSSVKSTENDVLQFRSNEIAVINCNKASGLSSTAITKDTESAKDLRKKYSTEVEELKLYHNKEILKLTEHINSLDNKIYALQKQSKVEKSPDFKDQQLEHLVDEIKSQEILLSGYERENKKLCKEISTLKDVWKQRENQLIEDKQRLQNELLGMVSKTTTEALEEQLKDAQETILKLEIELSTYKSSNKELEVTCDRLRNETQRLQADLRNCHCGRTVGRRDTYSFLASSNVGTQIQELKNVISRKDVEIAQLNTTLGILKGELSNRDLSLTPMYNQHLESYNINLSQLQTALSMERQNVKDLAKEKELLLKENLDLKRQVRELESIVKRRQRSDSCFSVSVSETQSNSRLIELEKELSARQESLSALHSQFLNMQKKYEDHIQELEKQLKECKEELQTLKVNHKREEASHLRTNVKKVRQGVAVVKEETHLLATIRGLRQEVATKEKEINKLHKDVEDVRLTNKRLQKEREKQLNSIPTKMSSIKEKANLRKIDKNNSIPQNNTSASTTSPNNNINPLLFAELQESNLMLKSKTKSLQEEVKRLEQDLIAMHNKRVHDLNVLQNEHDVELTRLMEERAALLSQSTSTELQGQVYTQQMVINHLKNRLKQMEELKNEVTLLRAERDHLEESLGAVNKKMCYLQNAQSPESVQYKTLLAKLETLEKNQEIREQKLNAVRELLCRSTQGQGQCSGTCRDKLLDKNRQICFYRAQMDRILEALLEIRRTK